MPGSIAQSVSRLTVIDREIISIVISPLPLIQEGQLSVIGESICTRIDLPLRELSLPRKKCE